jgi:hypothetical protein
MMVPVSFQMYPGSTASRNDWRAYLPGPISPAPWVTEDSLARVDPNELEDGEAAALESRFRLISDVIGKAL